MNTHAILVGLALYALFVARLCWFRVDEGAVAVVTRFGGALRGPGGALRTFGPGLHPKWPFDRAVVASLRERVVDLAGEKGGETLMLEDGSVIRIDSTLRYVLDRDGLERFLFGMKHPVEHVTGLFTCLMRNEVANVRAPRPDGEATAGAGEFGGAYAMLRKERGVVNRRIAEFSRQELGGRYGVTFNAVDITDIHPPDELADALNAVMSAQSAAEELRARAEAEAAQRVLGAEHGVHIARMRAEALEIEMARLGEHLGALDDQGVLPAYVERRRAEILSDVRTLYAADAGGGS